MTKMKRATILKFENGYVIHSDSTTINGYGIASEPYIIIDGSPSMERILNEILYSLESSKINVIDADSENSSKEYFKSIGIKRRKDLYKNSICCSVFEKDNFIILLPTANMGPSEGFRPYLDGKVEIPINASKEEKCNALVEALSRCE